MTRATLAALLLAAPVLAQPSGISGGLPTCPISAEALARLRAEHAAMDAAGTACLDALDAARAQRDRCGETCALRLEALAGELATSAAQLDAAATALAAPVPEAPPEGRPWALVALGGAVVAGAAAGAAALDAGPVEVAGVGLGVAAVAAGIAAVVAWAAGD